MFSTEVVRAVTAGSVAKSMAPVTSWTAGGPGRFAAVLVQDTMIKLWRLSLLLPALLAAAATLSAQGGAPPAQNTRLALTVDSIMRGPDLVGYPPDSLRWSADSSKLYFDWRRPGDEEASTYVVSRDGGAPSRLDDAGCVGASPRSRILRCARFRCSAPPSQPRPCATTAIGRETGQGHAAAGGSIAA